jgi:hypothetical protein
MGSLSSDVRLRDDDRCLKAALLLKQLTDHDTWRVGQMPNECELSTSVRNRRLQAEADCLTQVSANENVETLPERVRDRD